MGAGPSNEQSIGQLVSSAIADVQTLVRDQIELTKVEVSKSAKEFGNSAGLLIAAGTLAFVGFIFLLVTAAYVLSLWLPLWASFLIVAVVVLIVAAILALLGKKKIDKAKVGPQRAVAQAQQTRAALASATSSQSPISSVNGSVPALPASTQESAAR